jgi:hypothetical protein
MSSIEPYCTVFKGPKTSRLDEGLSSPSVRIASFLDEKRTSRLSHPYVDAASSVDVQNKFYEDIQWMFNKNSPRWLIDVQKSILCRGSNHRTGRSQPVVLTTRPPIYVTYWNIYNWKTIFFSDLSNKRISRPFLTVCALTLLCVFHLHENTLI